MGQTCIHSLLEFSIEDLCELSVNPNKLKIGIVTFKFGLHNAVGGGGWATAGDDV